MRGSFTPTINNQKPHKQSPRAGYHPHPMLTASFKSSKNQLSSVASINSHAEVVDKILAAAPASLCRSAKDLVYFQANTPNSTILHELNKHGITGAPVLRVPRRTNEVRIHGASLNFVTSIACRMSTAEGLARDTKASLMYLTFVWRCSRSLPSQRHAWQSLQSGCFRKTVPLRAMLSTEADLIRLPLFNLRIH